MEKSFWHSKWQNNDIAFHCGQPNPALVAYFQTLQLPAGSRILVPLCGKTRDIPWLRSQGHFVVGVELNLSAVEQFFQELGEEPIRSLDGPFQKFQTKNIEIYVGDFFEMTAKILGRVDAVYDRAALVALPEEMRRRYVTHLLSTTNSASQLLICFEYDQQQLDGPPFSVPEHEIRLHYQNSHQLSLLKSESLPEKLKGRCEAKETVWLLGNKKF